MVGERESSFPQILEYWWMANNETEQHNGSSDMEFEEVLQDPGSVILFLGYPQWLLYFAAVCCIFFMLVGIPGNLITVIALFRTKKLKNATAVFIMNLSISDLMFCCFNLPLATSTFWHSAWMYGPLLCRLFPLLRYGLVAVSLFSVLAITINRYVMIGHPGLYPTLYKTRYLIPMILVIWIVAFGVLIVTWFEQWGRFGLDPAIGSCSILPDVKGRSPKEFLFFLAFLIPCLAIIVCYARIFYIVRETASKSRGRDKIRNIEPTETSYDQRSMSTKNQEEELSVLCTPSSPIQEMFLHPDEEETYLELPSISVNENTSCYKQSIHEPNVNSATASQLSTSNVQGDPTNISIRLNRYSNSDYNVLHASLTDDIPFVDDREESGGTKTRSEAQRKSSRNSCGHLEKLTSRASLIMELSLQRIGRGDRWESPEVACSDTAEQSAAKKRKARRRQSKFRSIGKTRGASAPRMSAKDRRLLQMILVIFASFLVCYLPITITKLLQDAVDCRGLNIASYMLIYLTTCINPVIYVVMSSEYRSAYKYVLLCKRERPTNRKRRPPGLLMPS